MNKKEEHRIVESYEIDSSEIREMGSKLGLKKGVTEAEIHRSVSARFRAGVAEASGKTAEFCGFISL